MADRGTPKPTKAEEERERRSRRRGRVAAGLLLQRVANQLDADGKARGGETAGKRKGRMARDIEGPGEAGEDRPRLAQTNAPRNELLRRG